MAAGVSGFNLEVLSELVSKLDQVYVKLSQVEERLATISSTDLTLTISGRTAETLNTLVQNFEKLQNLDSESVSNIAKNLSNALDQLNKSDINDRLYKLQLPETFLQSAKGLNAFASAIARLGRSDVDVGLSIAKLSFSLKSLVDIDVSSIKSDNFNVFFEVGKSLASFALSFNRLSRLSESDFSNITTNVMNFIKNFSSFKIPQTFDRQILDISKSVSNIASVFKITSSLPLDYDITPFFVILDDFIDYLALASDEISKIEKVDLLFVISRLSRNMIDFIKLAGSKSDNLNVKNMFSVFDDLIHYFSTISDKIKSVQDLNDLSVLFKSFSQLANFFRVAKSIAVDFDIKGVIAIFEYFIGYIIRVSNRVSKLEGIDSLSSIFKYFSQLGEFSKSTRTITGSFDFTPIFTVLDQFIQFLIKTSDNVPKLDSIKDIISSLRLFIKVSELTIALENNSSITKNNLTHMFDSLKIFIDIISEELKVNTRVVDNLTTLRIILESIRDLFRLSKIVSNDPDYYKKLADLVSIIPILNNFTNQLKQIQTVPNESVVFFKKLSEVIRNISYITTIKENFNVSIIDKIINQLITTIANVYTKLNNGQLIKFDQIFPSIQSLILSIRRFINTIISNKGLLEDSSKVETIFKNMKKLLDGIPDLIGSVVGPIKFTTDIGARSVARILKDVGPLLTFIFKDLVNIIDEQTISTNLKNLLKRGLLLRLTAAAFGIFMDAIMMPFKAIENAKLGGIGDFTSGFGRLLEGVSSFSRFIKSLLEINLKFDKTTFIEITKIVGFIGLQVGLLILALAPVAFLNPTKLSALGDISKSFRYVLDFFSFVNSPDFVSKAGIAVALSVGTLLNKFFKTVVAGGFITYLLLIFASMAKLGGSDLKYVPDVIKSLKYVGEFIRSLNDNIFSNANLITDGLLKSLNEYTKIFRAISQGGFVISILIALGILTRLAGENTKFLPDVIKSLSSISDFITQLQSNVFKNANLITDGLLGSLNTSTKTFRAISQSGFITSLFLFLGVMSKLAGQNMAYLPDTIISLKVIFDFVDSMQQTVFRNANIVTDGLLSNLTQSTQIFRATVQSGFIGSILLFIGFMSKIGGVNLQFAPEVLKNLYVIFSFVEKLQTTVFKSVNLITDGLLQDLTRSTKTFNALSQSGFINSILLVIGVMSRLGGEDLQYAPAVLNSLSSVFNFIEGLQTNVFKSANIIKDGLFEDLTKTTKMFNALSQGGFVSSLLLVIGVLSKLGGSGLKDIPSVLSSLPYLGSFIDSINSTVFRSANLISDGLLADLNKNTKVFRALTQSGFLSSILLALAAFSKLAGVNTQYVGPVLQALPAIGTLIESLNRTIFSSANLIQDWLLKDFNDQIKMYRSLTQGGFVAALLGLIGAMARLGGSALQYVPGILSSLPVLADFLSQLRKTIFANADLVTESGPLEEVNKTAKKFRALTQGGFLSSILLMIGVMTRIGGSNLQYADKAAVAIKAVTDFLSAVSRNVTSSFLDYIPIISDIKRASELFKAIVQSGLFSLAAVVFLLATRLSNVSAITSMVNFFDSMSKLYVSLKSSAKNDLSMENVKTYFAQVDFILNSIRRLKLSKNVDSSFLNSVIGLISALSNIKVDLPDTLTRIAPAFKDFVSSFNSLNIDDRSSKSIVRIIDSLKNIPRNIPNIPKIDVNAPKSTNTAYRNSITELNSLLSIIDRVTSAVKSMFQAFASLTNIVGLVNNVSRSVVELGRNVREVGDNIMQAGQNMGQVFTGFLRNQTFSTVSEFDKIGTQLQVFGGLTNEARREAEDFALQIGKNYPLSANEALQATTDLIKAGQSLASTKFILPSASDLAALSGSSLPDATNLLILAESTFSSFRDGVEGSFENIDKAADILSAAADASTASVQSLGEGLANVSSTANIAGITLEETAAILAILDESGKKGAEGGTALASMFNSLTKPKTQKALSDLQRTVRGFGKEFKDLNVSLYNPDGSRRNINDYFNSLGIALKAIEERQGTKGVDAYINRLADTYGKQGLQIILAGGTDAIKNMIEAMNDVAPASERAASMLDNFAGDVEQLKGSVETLYVKALKPSLEEFFRPFVKIGRLVVDTLISMDTKIVSFLGSMLSVSVTGVGSLAALTLSFGGLLKVGGAVISSLGYMINVLKFATWFMGLLSGSVIGLVTAFTALTVIVPVIAGVTATFKSLYTILSQDLGGAASGIRNVFGVLGEFFSSISELGNSVINLIKEAFGDGAGTNGLLDAAGASIANFFNNIASGLKNGAIGRVTQAFKDMAGIITAFTSVMTVESRRAKQIESRNRRMTEDGIFSEEDIEASVKSTETNFDKAYKSLIDNVVKNNKLFKKVFGESFSPDQFIQLAESLRSNFNTIGNVIADFRKRISEGVVGGNLSLPELLGLGNDTAGKIAGELATIFGTLFNIDLSQVAANFTNGGFIAGIQDLFRSLISKAGEVLLNNKESLRTAFIGVLEFAFSPVKLVGLIGDIFDIKALQDIASGFEEVMKNVFGGIFDTLVALLSGKDIETALNEGFGKTFNSIIELIRGVGRSISLLFKYISESISSFISSIGISGETVTSVVNDIIKALADVIKIINDEFFTPLAEEGLFAALGNVLKLAFETIKTVVADIISYLSTIDIASVVSTFVATLSSNLVSGLSSALSTAVSSVGGDTNSLKSLFETTLSSLFDISSTGLEGAFATLPAALSGALATALTAGIELLGSTLNLDVSAVTQRINDTLQSIFDGIKDLVGFGEENGIIDNIRKFVDTIQKLFDVITGNNTDNASKTAYNLNILTAALQSIANLPLAIIDQAIRTIDSFFDFIGSLEPQDIALVAAGIVTFAGAYTVLTTAASLGGIANLLAMKGLFGTLGTIAWSVISGGISAVAGAITTLMNSVVGKMIGVASVVLVIATFVQNLGQLKDVIDNLLKGDLFGALGEAIQGLIDFLGDIGINLLKLLGFDEGFIRGVQTTLDQVGVLINLLFTGLGVQITSFFENVFNKIGYFFSTQLPLILAKAGAEAVSLANPDRAIDGQIAGIEKYLGGTDFSAAKDLASTTDGSFIRQFTNTGNALNDAISDYARKTLVSNIDNFVRFLNEESLSTEGFSTDIGALNLEQYVGALNASGGVDEAIGRAFAMGYTDLANQIIAEADAKGYKFDIAPVINNAAREIVNSVGQQGMSMTPEMVDSAVAQLETMRAELVERGFSTDGVDSEIARVQGYFSMLVSAAAKSSEGAAEEAGRAIGETASRGITNGMSNVEISSPVSPPTSTITEDSSNIPSNPISVPVEVNPVVTEVTPIAEDSTNLIKNSLESDISESIVELSVPAQATLDILDVDTLTPEAITVLSEVFAKLSLELKGVHETINTLVKPAINELSLSIETLINVNISNFTTSATGMANTLTTIVLPSIEQIKASFNNMSLLTIPVLNSMLMVTSSILSINFPISASSTATAVKLIEEAFFSLGNTVTRVTSLLLNVAEAAASASQNAADATGRIAEAAVGSANAVTNSLGGGSSKPQGRASGGTVKQGMYRINEQGSEVLIERGKMYLLSSGLGKIEPLSKGLLPNFDPTARTMGNNIYSEIRKPPMNSNEYSYNTYNEGDIVVNVTVDSSASAKEISNRVAEAIRRQRPEQISAKKNFRSNQQ